jgi:hypothetical protein
MDAIDMPVDEDLIKFLGNSYRIYKNIDYDGNIYRCKFALLDNGAGSYVASNFYLISLHLDDNEIINTVFGEMIKNIYSSYEDIETNLDSVIESWIPNSFNLKFVD